MTSTLTWRRCFTAQTATPREGGKHMHRSVWHFARIFVEWDYGRNIALPSMIHPRWRQIDS